MMSEKKIIKKELKVCKKQIKYSNYAVRGFMRTQQYQKGSYRKLQRTGIWRNAKNQLLHYHKIKYHRLVCFKCGQPITDTPVLHHKKYNWKRLFSPQYVSFTHRACHEEVHSGKKGYKRSLSYFEIKFLIMVIGIIIIFIIFSLMSLTQG
jgi:hypothetical protein